MNQIFGRSAYDAPVVTLPPFNDKNTGNCAQFDRVVKFLACGCRNNPPDILTEKLAGLRLHEIALDKIQGQGPPLLGILHVSFRIVRRRQQKVISRSIEPPSDR
jgi:hypothetical protein